VSLQNNNNNKIEFCVFSILNTCLHVISYRCEEYVLFHLNMLRLFLEMNMFLFFWRLS
jgi:hypothetical protein